MTLRGWEGAVAAVLTASVVVYTAGVIRLWAHSGRGHGLRVARVVAFAFGIAALVVALLSPLDALADVLFSAHMGQHELLMLVAAPLLMLGRPWLAASWVFPAGWRRRWWSALTRPGARQVWRLSTAPVIILVAHGLALWIWHVPSLFEAALRHEALHTLQHGCFFVTAALFWWALAEGRYGRAGYGAAVVFVFLTGMHSGILGALLTFARQPWYPLHAGRTAAGGVDPVGDQQVAGLIMWVPAGAVLMVLGLAFLAAWLGESERRLRRGRVPQH